MTSFAALLFRRSMSGTGKWGSVVTAIIPMLGAAAAYAAEKPPLTGPELLELLGNGLSVTAIDMNGGKNFTGKVTYVSGGSLSGTITFTGKQPVPISGTWKVEGGKLCRTIVPLQPQQVCETWVRSGNKEVTIRVGNGDVGVSRWQ